MTFYRSQVEPTNRKKQVDLPSIARFARTDFGVRSLAAPVPVVLKGKNLAMRTAVLRTSLEAVVELADIVVGKFGIVGQSRRETIAVAHEY